MKMNPWKVYIQNAPASHCIQLSFIRETYNGNVEYMHFVDGNLTLTEAERYGMIQPLLTFPPMEAQEILQSLTEALDEKGYKVPSTEKTKGILEATQYHLKDMRTLLKLK